MKNENKNYEIRKDSQKIIIGVHLFPGKDYGIEYIQIKLIDIQATLETLKNIDHDPSEEGNGHEGDGRVVNKLFFKQDEDYLLCIRTEYDFYMYNIPRYLRIMAFWKDKSLLSSEFAISYWTYEELKTEVDRLVDAIETALKK